MSRRKHDNRLAIGIIAICGAGIVIILLVILLSVYSIPSSLSAENDSRAHAAGETAVHEFTLTLEAR